MPDPRKVFISYSHDSDEHSAAVKGLADSLRQDGVDCMIDQYHSKGPGDGWPLWSEKQIEQADLVLLVCTKTYLRRVRKEEPKGTGHGATWEAHIIYQLLYESFVEDHKFIPVVFNDTDKVYIPTPLRAANHYLLDAQKGYEKLYRHITDQPGVILPVLGLPKVMSGQGPTPSFKPAAKAKPPGNLPPRNDKFVGRETELDEIHERLNEKGEIGVTQQTAAHGLGGIGKTSIAIEYAWKHLDDYPGGLFIVLCDRDLLLPEIVNLASHLGMDESETPEQTAERVKQRLETGEPSLLILDNVRSAEQFNDSEWSSLLPAGNCRRLITTRAVNLGPSVQMYSVERLPRDKGSGRRSRGGGRWVTWNA